MVKNFFLLIIALFLLTGCDTKLRDLTMKRIPYLGDELRIDGYYYSNPNPDVGYGIGVAVFYRDGFCIHLWTDIKDQDTLNFIKDEILLNETLINKMKNDPNHIGTFQVIFPDIQFEVWERKSITGTHLGKIINDTTFMINKWINHESNETYSKDLTYRFKQFFPKPDSTNNFVK
jgi:hypothetical protein